MKITKGQLRRIIRESLQGGSMDHDTRREIESLAGDAHTVAEIYFDTYQEQALQKFAKDYEELEKLLTPSEIDITAAEEILTNMADNPNFFNMPDDYHGGPWSSEFDALSRASDRRYGPGD